MSRGAGLAIETGYWQVIRSTSPAAADPRGSVTCGTAGTGADEGRGGVRFGFGRGDGGIGGSATYRGAAPGVWATEEVSGGRVTAASSGAFTAEAVLTAHFFGARDAGEIGSFRTASGRTLAGWRMTLSLAMLSTGEAGFAAATGGTVGSGTSGTGSWQGRFHGSDRAETNAQPSHASGRFDPHFPGAHIAGPFAAGRRR